MVWKPWRRQDEKVSRTSRSTPTALENRAGFVIKVNVGNQISEIKGNSLYSELANVTGHHMSWFCSENSPKRRSQLSGRCGVKWISSVLDILTRVTQILTEFKRVLKNYACVCFTSRTWKSSLALYTVLGGPRHTLFFSSPVGQWAL